MFLRHCGVGSRQLSVILGHTSYRWFEHQDFLDLLSHLLERRVIEPLQVVSSDLQASSGDSWPQCFIERFSSFVLDAVYKLRARLHPTLVS